MELRNLILAAGDAALEIEKSKFALEEAKALVESAKTAVAEANGVYDQVLADCEAAGLVRSKVRKAVEELKQAYITAGLFTEASVAAPDNEVEKPRRKRKSKNDEVSAETDHEVTGPQEDTEVPSEPVEASKAVNEAPVVEPVVKAETAAEVENVHVVTEAVDEAGTALVTESVYLVDNSDMVTDIQHLIDESIAKSDVNVVGDAGRILADELKAAAEAATSESYEMDLDYFRAHLATRQTVVGEAASAFIRVISAIEAGENDVPALYPVEDNLVEYDIIDDYIEETDLIDEVDQSAQVDDGVDDDDRFGEDEPVGDEAIDVSDDDTFPITDENPNLAVVENIDSMNFLEAEPVVEDKPIQAEPTATNAPPARKPFAAPAFMQNRK